jgi:hypothetical protein
MPIIWIGFSTNSPQEVHELRNQPLKLKAYVEWVVANAVPADAQLRPSLEDFYFEVGADRACAVVRDLDDYVAVKVVTRKLGADYVKKFVEADKAEEAIQRLINFPDNGGRPDPSDGPGPDAV